MNRSIQSNPLRWWILANIAVGTFMSVLDGGIANVGLPTIAKSMHTDISTVQWVIIAYLLTISSALPIVGKLSDMLGKTRIYAIGFLVFALGSLLCGFSENIGMLISTRILQAIGASFLMANSQGIVAQTFSAKERGQALGITGTVVAIGGLAGPPIGGLLIGWFGWSSIFWVNVPIGVLGYLASLKILPKSARREAKEPFDYLGSLLFVIGMVALLYSLSRAEQWGWTSTTLMLGLILAVVALAAFFVREKWTHHPMVDFTLYRSKVFALGTVAGLFSFVAMFCMNIIIPFYLQDVLHLIPATTGYVMAASPVIMALVAPISGRLSDKIGPVVLTTTGLSISGIGFILLNFLSAQTNVWIVALHLAIFGLGQGMFQSPNNSAVMGAVPRDKLGLAGGINALMRNVGMVLGISLSVSLFTHRLNVLSPGAHATTATASPAYFMSALHTVFWAAAIVCFAGISCSFARGSNRKEEHQTA